MKATLRLVVALFLGAAIQACFVGPALAQGPASGPPAAGSAVPPADDDANATDLPVLYVTSVEILRTAVAPRLEIVQVNGLAASQGWSTPQLVPTYAGKPADDILDLQLIATAPERSQPAGGFVPVSAVFPLEPGHSFKGVRVRASENAIEVRDMPGSQQATIGGDGCKDCLGKKFVAAADTQAGTAGSVGRRDLPKSLRVIAPSDGIRGAEQDPNRLTLILGDDNTIVEAFWE